MLDILILGATGLSGRQVALYLSKHSQRSSFTFGIAGRSKSKLDAVAAELATSNVPVFVFDVTDEAQVSQVVRNAKIVINAIGPFWKWGTPVVRACVTHHVHYVDLTGETHWIKEIVRAFDFTATKSKTIIVPSCGIDSLPSDVSVYLARKTLNSVFPEKHLDIDTSVTAFEFFGFTGLSGGTSATIMTAFDVDNIGNILGEPYLLSPVVGYPPPRPRLTYSLQEPDTGKWLVGGYYLMQISNSAIVQRSWGLRELEALNSHSASVEAERYGPTFKYDEFFVTSNRLMGMVMTAVIGLTPILMSLFPPLKWLYKATALKSGQGPSDSTMQNGMLRTTNITTTIPTPSQSSLQVKTTFSAKGEPGYYVSSHMVAESALCIHFSKDSLPSLGQQGGVLTPSTAFGDVLIERLRNNGFEIVSSVVSADKKTV